MLCDRWSALAGDQLEKCPLTVIPVVVFISDLYPPLFNVVVVVFFLNCEGHAERRKSTFFSSCSSRWSEVDSWSVNLTELYGEAPQ